MWNDSELWGVTEESAIEENGYGQQQIDTPQFLAGPAIELTYILGLQNIMLLEGNA